MNPRPHGITGESSGKKRRKSVASPENLARLRARQKPKRSDKRDGKKK